MLMIHINYKSQDKKNESQREKEKYEEFIIGEVL